MALDGAIVRVALSFTEVAAARKHTCTATTTQMEAVNFVLTPMA